MSAERTQLDLLRNSPTAMAKAWRAAAETSLAQYPNDAARHNYYVAEAARFEAMAKQDKQRNQQ